jgi:hypothetical protein
MLKRLRVVRIDGGDLADRLGEVMWCLIKQRIRVLGMIIKHRDNFILYHVAGKSMALQIYRPRV